MGLEGNDYILFAARLVPEKGAHYLIEAFRRLDCSVKLVVAGDDPFEKRYIRSLHEMAGNDPRILFPHYVSGDAFLELMTNARLFVLPSEIEGMPVALLEAMSYGKCCVVSDIPENLEALNDHGYVFRNKSVEDLIGVLRIALEDWGAAQAFGEEARNYVLTQYSWDRIVELYEDFYRKVIADSQVGKLRSPKNQNAC
jgi:glycosyltransferase involved in cell wall biosynthesis